MKPLILTGRNEEQKESFLKTLLLFHEEDLITMINNNHSETFDDPFLFDDCTRKTKVVVMKNLRINQLRSLSKIVTYPLIVKRRAKPAFSIFVSYIFLAETHLLEKEINADPQQFITINTDNTTW